MRFPLLEKIDARRKREELAWPVGAGAVPLGDLFHGHDQSEFSPEEYGDYAATSNEIYSVASKRARLMSGLTLKLYRGQGADKDEVTSGPAAELLARVNPFWTPRRLARMDELSMCLWGHTAWAIERRAGRPDEIWWLKPSRLRPVPHKTDYLKGFLYEPITGGPLIPFNPDEVIWFRHPNPLDEFSPLSPLAAARLAADTASAMMKSNQALFVNGLQGGGVVVPPANVTYTQQQAEDLSALLEHRRKGVDKAHRWLVLRMEAQLKGLNVTPKDAEFLGGLNFTLRQVCNAFGMQSALLNDLEHATLSNVRDLERHEWASTLKPDAELRADEIKEQLLPLFGGSGPDHCEYDFTAVPALQESASEAWAREAQAIDRGALTINEWRKSKGLPAVPWGDVYWAPVNKAAVKDGASSPQQDTPPDQAPETEVDELARRHMMAAFNGHGRGH